MKVGDKVGYKNKVDYGDAIMTVKKIDSNYVYYEEGGFDYVEDLEVVATNTPNGLYSENTVDNVVNPAHYTSTKISALDVVNDWELDFYLGNTLKYIKRHELKGNPVQDLEKAVQYLQLKIQLLKDGNIK